MSDKALAALAYAARGWRVFPCRPRDKRPATRHGCKDATTDAERIARYWHRVPDANIGIATGEQSGIWVLDVDGVDGLSSLVDIESRAELPATLTQTTGGGGMQMFWRWPPGREVKNSTGRVANKIDVRGGGGYVIAPPSIHPSGIPYRWRDDPDAPVLDAPVWLLDMVCERPATARPAAPLSVLRILKTASVAGAIRWLAEQPEGRRNSALYWTAHRLRDHGYTQTDAERVLVPVAMSMGLPEREALATVRSAWRM